MGFPLKKHQGKPVFVEKARKLIFPFGEDLTSATSPKVYYRNPGGDETSQTGTIETPGTDGKVSYDFTTELDAAGEWIMWAGVVLSGDDRLSGVFEP